MKNKEGQEQTLDADWRHLHLGGFKVILFKGVALSKEQLGHFDKDAQTHYLEDRKIVLTDDQIAKAKEKAEAKAKAKLEAKAKAEAKVAEAKAKLEAEGKKE